jgi:hypothetical protein
VPLLDPQGSLKATYKTKKPRKNGVVMLIQVEFGVPIVISDLAVALSAEEIELLRRVRLGIYGDDDAAALRDILFSWWEERFLSAHSGAPAIGGNDEIPR